jgi:hypothetical protein
MFKNMFIFLPLLVIYTAPLTANESILDIRWQDKKLSIKAKGVTLCEVLEELAEKTNTTIRNDNPCDNLVNFNLEKKSFDDALKKIFNKDSYVLVDDDTKRKLLIYKRGTGEQSTYNIIQNRAPVESYTPESAPTDTSSIVDTQPYEQYHDTNAIDVSATSVIPAETIETSQPDLPEPIPYPTDPPFNPETLEKDMVEGGPATDPNEVFLDPSVVQPPPE